ncbi:phage tail protein [Campylobacter sputorum]|uniref:phage tail protein n=1 Tax=Campylobacter sputorum TaxID=206 RepID=UPI0006921AD8|nr:phage tail protein [Campylobacter sputorum]
MFDLRTYSDEVFRVDEVLEKTLQKSLNFDTKFFYKNNDFNSNFLVNTFDIDTQDKNSKEISELLIEPLKTHFLEGTKYSLQKALKTFFGDSEIFEWHEYNGKPYHFKVKGIDITNSGTDKNALNHLDKTINEYKNVRSVCESIEFTQNKKFKQFVGVAFNVAVSVNLYPSVETKLESIFTKEISSYTHTQETINLA